MILKRYWYSGGFNITAPLKCGTRWLADYTEPLGFSKYESHYELSKLYVGKDKINYFLYREPSEHFITALHTEVLTYAREKNLESLNLKPIVDRFKINYGEHWSLNLWEKLYEDIPNMERNFDFVNLKNLSKLFNNKFPHKKEEYDFLNNKLHLTKPELLIKLKKEYPNEWIYFNEIIKKETVIMNKVIYQSKKMNYGL
jgi:hypothetical protein